MLALSLLYEKAEEQVEMKSEILYMTLSHVQAAGLDSESDRGGSVSTHVQVNRRTECLLRNLTIYHSIITTHVYIFTHISMYRQELRQLLLLRMKRGLGRSSSTLSCDKYLNRTGGKEGQYLERLQGRDRILLHLVVDSSDQLYSWIERDGDMIHEQRDKPTFSFPW